MRCRRWRGDRLACLALLVTVARTDATDVAFWSEYEPLPHDERQTALLLQFGELPPNAERVGTPEIVDGGRFGKALRLDGRSALRIASTNAFEGGQVSIEAWIKLERYPEREGYIVFRPACIDGNATYDPSVDRAKGYGLAVAADGALMLEVVNMFYGRRTRTRGAPGGIPLHRWVHVAGISGNGRHLFIDGHEVVDLPIHWGEGLTVRGEEESRPQPTYIGNNEHGDAGLTGLVDQVRVHRNVHKLWPREDDAWTDPDRRRDIVNGPPCFVAEHAPRVYLPLDGSDAATGTPGVRVRLSGSDYRPGVRGRAFAGRVELEAPGLFRAAEGSLEFWLRPLGINNLSDKNVSFVNEPFSFYLFNGGKHEPTLYFRVKDDDLHFVHAPMEVHPGHWFHFVLTWRGRDIRIYTDGRETGRTTTQPLAPNGLTTADRFVLDAARASCLLDEIRVYDCALLPEEAANAYRRYRAPESVMRNIHLPSVECLGEYLPSRQTVYYRLHPFGSTNGYDALRMDLRRTDRTDPRQVRRRSATVADNQSPPTDSDASPIRSWSFMWRAGTAGTLELPPLEDGEYALRPTVTTVAGRAIAGVDFHFLARRFAWEGNMLGITNAVTPPFTPIELDGSRVSVVGRTMTLNAFGLPDSVVVLGHELLAAPVSIHFATADGEGQWRIAAGGMVTNTPTAAVFEGGAVGNPIALRTRSTIEIDGCMKIEMALAPGMTPGELRGVWIDLPLKNAEAPLMHAIADGLRHNISGAIPAGHGRVWDGSRAHRSQPWRNDFVPYVWLGSAERGLAFFAENDRGWITEKGAHAAPTHELLREGDRLTLRVHLLNRPAQLASPRTLVFGMQASPTKPMPPDWRRRLPDAPGGLAVVPWGGIQCASQGPFADDWTIVDKMLEARRGLPFDEKWLTEYVARHRPPKVHNSSDWAYMQHHFVGRARAVGMTRPLAVYQEEMRAAHSRPEWVVFQDEWKTTDGPAARTPPGELDLRGGQRSLSDISQITFTRSYADFGAWMANEWLKRGLSLYWDNTYLYPSFNTRTTAAYVAEDGHIQPALIIWNVREYHKRVWHLLQAWRRKRTEPLEWTLHMTNTEVLPVHTWGTVQLDHELALKHPFSPEWLQTETIGRQVGNLPLSLYEVYGRDNPLVSGLPPEHRSRIDWGLRAVHEIQRTDAAEHLLTDFGYGDADVTVHNYWEERPVVHVVPADTVKWLTLAKPATSEMLIVVASWSTNAVEAVLRVDPVAANLTAPTGWLVTDAETGRELSRTLDADIPVSITAPYGNRVLRIGR